MSLSHLIYLSSLDTESVPELPEIVRTSVRNNTARGITGMLLCYDRDVIQVLEGERKEIDQVFEKIQRDGRHSGIMVLINREIEARQFTNWSMGYHQLTGADLAAFPDIATIFKYAPNEIETRARPGLALILLKSFSDNLVEGRVKPIR